MNKMIATVFNDESSAYEGTKALRNSTLRAVSRYTQLPSLLKTRKARLVSSKRMNKVRSELFSDLPRGPLSGY